MQESQCSRSKLRSVQLGLPRKTSSLSRSPVMIGGKQVQDHVGALEPFRLIWPVRGAG